MAESPRASLPNITALPPTTALQIGSGQVLVDPSSVVKELIDNALDARAKSVFVDITANTIDTIQVKDDGHGIPSEDRPLVCRRHCTSKVRDLRDLKELGGKWLGFRGEALSSMAEMSSSLLVTTRVEGDLVAVKLKFQRNGEVDKIERESHPVGTTVRVTGFFEHIPVRKQTAIKNSSQCLAKIRHLLQAYAFARPAVRFRLRVLKAKSHKREFVYAPGSKVSIEDAALKVVGKDCALQCDWTALEADGFQFHAFLPKPNAIGFKVSNYGAFISIDARPVSSLRGTAKQLAAAFKARLRKMSPSMVCVKDPFICVNIVCPPDSYDPNIEPAKDDVMFENSEVVLSVFNQLLNTHYPETVMVPENDDLPTSAQQPQLTQAIDLPSRMCTPILDYDADSNPLEGTSASDFHAQPQWRSSMYGIDEDDMQFIQSEQPPIIAEEEGVRAAEVSNPWTIARMNAAVKPRRPVVMNQLLSPAKSQHHKSPQSSPVAVNTPHRDLYMDPLTPQSLSKVNTSNRRDDELERSITPMAPHSPCEETHSVENHNGSGSQLLRASRVPPSTNSTLALFNERNHGFEKSIMATPEYINTIDTAQGLHLPKSSAPHHKQRRQHMAYVNKPFAPAVPALENSGTWFGQRMRGSGSQSMSLQTRLPKAQDAIIISKQRRSRPQRNVLDAADRIVENQLYSEDNTDIRDFFGRGSVPNHGTVSSGLFTPIISTSRTNHREISEHAHDIGEQFRAYAERASPTRASSAGAPSKLLDAGDGQVYQHTRPSTISKQPSSIESNQQLQLLDMPPYPPTATAYHHNENRLEKSQAMEAHFKAIEEREAPHSNEYLHSTHRNAPLNLLPHEKRTKYSSRPRRRTTNGLERTNSSKLPLERVPHGYHIQNLILPIQITISTIIQASCKLDMRLNSLGWGYPADDALDVFAEPASASRVTSWTITLDGLLHGLFDRLSGVDTVCLLHEGVQRGFDERTEEELGKPIVSHAGLAGLAVGDGINSTFEDGGLSLNDDQDQSVQVKETENEVVANFDMSQCLDLHAEVSVSTAEKTAMQDLGQSDEEFADEIDDDMLLDL